MEFAAEDEGLFVVRLEGEGAVEGTHGFVQAAGLRESKGEFEAGLRGFRGLGLFGDGHGFGSPALAGEEAGVGEAGELVG